MAAHGERGFELGFAVAECLLRRSFRRFHVDCIGVRDDEAHGLRARVREQGLTGHLTLVVGDAAAQARAPGVYDVVLARDCLHREGELGGLLGRMTLAMAPSSVLLVDEPVGSVDDSGVRGAVVERLASFLLRRHRAESVPVEDRLVDARWLSTVASRYEFLEAIPYGGLIEAFLGPSSPYRFDAARREDLRFLDYVGTVEALLRDSGKVTPGRILACLRNGRGLEHGGAVLPLRVEPSPEPFDAASLQFRFARTEELVSHVMSGDGDERFLGEGFFPWEPDARVRWSGRVSSLRFELPREPSSFVCQVTLHCLEPGAVRPGGASWYVNGVHAGRVEDVYQRLASDPAWVLRFETLGGPVTLTLDLDAAQKPPDSEDVRELGLVVQSFQVVVQARE